MLNIKPPNTDAIFVRLSCRDKNRKRIPEVNGSFQSMTSGIESGFIKLHKRKCGIKLFPAWSEAKKSMEMQKLGNFYKIAPDCHAKIYRFHLYKGGSFPDLELCSAHKKTFWGYFTEEAKQKPSVPQRQRDRLTKKFLDIFGIAYCDDHAGNFGYVGKKPVIIDFGSVSTGD